MPNESQKMSKSGLHQRQKITGGRVGTFYLKYKLDMVLVVYYLFRHSK